MLTKVYVNLQLLSFTDVFWSSEGHDGTIQRFQAKSTVPDAMPPTHSALHDESGWKRMGYCQIDKSTWMGGPRGSAQFFAEIPICG